MAFDLGKIQYTISLLPKTFTTHKFIKMYGRKGNFEEDYVDLLCFVRENYPEKHVFQETHRRIGKFLKYNQQWLGIKDIDKVKSVDMFGMQRLDVLQYEKVKDVKPKYFKNPLPEIDEKTGLKIVPKKEEEVLEEIAIETQVETEIKAETPKVEQIETVSKEEVPKIVDEKIETQQKEFVAETKEEPKKKRRIIRVNLEDLRK